ncbi:MAG TPA: TlpA family protein disulfide reductase [bacterium]|nr:TlpA family protein disulfide reductase [bacterium]
MKKIVAVFLTSALLVFASVSCGAKKEAPGGGSSQSPQSAAQQHRDAAPDFSMPSIKTGEIRLSDHKGKVIILDFWATWCPPCRAKIPFFMELQEEYGKKGFTMIGAAINDTEDKIKNYAKSQKINYPVGMADRKMANDYGGITGLPTTFVIDRQGVIRKVYVGFRPKSVFEADIKELL